MNKQRHLIVIDPTAFAGGSKVATESILSLLDSQQFRITVLTADKQSWLSKQINRVNVYEPKCLAQKEQGIGYFIRHGVLALQLLWARLRFGRIDVALGASGPGVDLALYLLRPLMQFPIIQLIHGPVAQSRTIARCLQAAQHVHYLQSSIDSLNTSLATIGHPKTALPRHFHRFENGLNEKQWPSECQRIQPVVFWAASLLKWKGLDLLLEVLKQLPEKQRPITNICYIKPQSVQLPVSDAPVKINNVVWYENPKDIDTIRANANIFVSTSHQEPFGLSILEAMAAGQCVLIPADGAYWDQVLTDHINCIKYLPQQAEDLQQKLIMLTQDMALVKRLGQQASLLARGYSASQQYQRIIKHIDNSQPQISTKIRVNRGLV